MINNKNEKRNYQNSKALFVMQIIAMSFAILAVVVFVTVTLYKWISELNAKIKNSQTKIARMSARLNRLRKARVKHILKLRRAQKKENKKKKKIADEDSDVQIDNGNIAIDGFDNFIPDGDSVEFNELDEYLKEEIEDMDESDEEE